MNKLVRAITLVLVFAAVLSLGAFAYAEGAYDYASLLPQNPNSIYGNVLKKSLDGNKFPSSDWDKIKVVCDSYNTRLTYDGKYTAGYDAHMSKDNALNLPISFYYGDNILYYAEVRSKEDISQIDYQLYYWKDELVAYRHLPDLCLRFSDYTNDYEDYSDILSKFGSVYSIGMLEQGS